jgi:hypothetical protein
MMSLYTEKATKHNKVLYWFAEKISRFTNAYPVHLCKPTCVTHRHTIIGNEHYLNHYIGDVMGSNMCNTMADLDAWKNCMQKSKIKRLV